MNTIALIVMLLMSFLWYFLNSRIRIKQKSTPHLGDYWGVVGKDEIEKCKLASGEENECSKEEEPLNYIGRLHYSIPGKSYNGLIWKGRILKTDERTGFWRRP
jgi:hypothetical protein